MLFKQMQKTPTNFNENPRKLKTHFCVPELTAPYKLLLLVSLKATLEGVPPVLPSLELVMAQSQSPANLLHETISTFKGRPL